MTNDILLSMNKKQPIIQLIENYDEAYKFVCLSCEKVLYDSKLGIEEMSYFVYVKPNNARMCKKCAGCMIERGVD